MKNKGTQILLIGDGAVGKTSIIKRYNNVDIGMDHLSGLTLHNVVTAMSEGTHHALTETGQPVRHSHIECLNEQNIGRLIMHFFLETKFASALMGINPYGQQGVERGKVITREFLRKLKN